MNSVLYSHQQLLTLGKLTQEDFELINQRRRPHNRLGFAYQLAFVRLFNRFPSQQPFEIEPELLTYVGVQLDVAISHIDAYAERQPTLSEHQEQIRAFLQLQRFGQAEQAQLQQYVFDEASRLEHTNPLMIKVKQFLKDQRILQPADDTLRRLIIHQRQAAREHIFERISKSLSSDLHQKLDDLLVAGKRRRTPFQTLKQPPGQATPKAMLRLVSKLEHIEETTVLSVDLSWLNNNYQRSLTHYAHRCSADRLRKLQADHRYAVLVCFLRQVYQDTIDYIIDMHDKLMLGVHNRAQNEIDEQTKKQRRMIRTSLAALRTLGRVILDESVDDERLRSTLFEQIDRDELTAQLDAVEVWLDGKYSHVFNLVMQRFSYIRQFSPALLAALQFRAENNQSESLLEAIQLLHELNEANKRKLPEDVPLDFIPNKLRDFVETSDGTVNKHAWECALLTAIRDELKAGNIFVQDSKRFGRFDDFFIADTQWHNLRDTFFNRAGLPVNSEGGP